MLLADAAEALSGGFQLPWLESIAQIGIVAFLLLFFVWQSSKEKTAMSERISSVEDYQRHQLVTMVSETSSALTNSTKAINDNTLVMDRLCTRIDGMRDGGSKGNVS